MSPTRVYTKADLLEFKPRHDSFVGIDSDGCVFPTMEIKQKLCFHPLIVSVWGLERIEKQVRECAEFVNLHSRHRGQNRFPCLLMTFELLWQRPAVLATGVTLPPLGPLRKFCESGLPLGNQVLEQYARETADPEMARVLRWSNAVNVEVAAKARHIRPFQGVQGSLQAIRRHSDAICVSQTPTEALVREWEENQLMEFVSVIAGQELGSKSEHLAMATRDRYPADRVLMIGDAPGDLKAARSVGALFFPIDPGEEAMSWNRFQKESYPRFLNGTYDRDYETTLVRHFEALLPDTPPWKTAQPQPHRI